LTRKAPKKGGGGGKQKIKEKGFPSGGVEGVGWGGKARKKGLVPNRKKKGGGGRWAKINGERKNTRAKSSPARCRGQSIC